MQQKENLLKQIPHVDRLMQNELIEDCGVYRHEVTDAVRDVLDDLRRTLKSGEIDKVPCDDEIVRDAIKLANLQVHGKGVERVINGTGVILHSNLGRASLSKAAAEAVVKAAASYCTLEYDKMEGKRGNRTEGIEKYLCRLTGCEAALIVNNNAAAVLLILSTIANGGNVIVSRGELVEIGGGFRIPEIITQCGCTLREVGTTNKTRLTDYEAAIDKDTKVILKVHSSNFKIVGFSESVTIAQLTKLGKERGIPVIEDIGSGALIDVSRYGLHGEPLAKDSLKNGADIVSFSGDKLLGGLQCGVILGSEKYISAMKKHPIYRALRVDKMTIAALEATLRVYADTNLAQQVIPVLSMLSLSGDVLKERAQRICDAVRERGGKAEAVQTKSVAGGGAVPGLELESYAISLVGVSSLDRMQEVLRTQVVPIIGRIENDKLILDMRTIFEEDFEYIIDVIVDVTT